MSQVKKLEIEVNSSHLDTISEVTASRPESTMVLLSDIVRDLNVKFHIAAELEPYMEDVTFKVIAPDGSEFEDECDWNGVIELLMNCEDVDAELDSWVFESDIRDDDSWQGQHTVITFKHDHAEEVAKELGYQIVRVQK